MRLSLAILLLVFAPVDGSWSAPAFLAGSSMCRTSSTTRIRQITSLRRHGNPQSAQQQSHQFQIPSYLALDRGLRGPTGVRLDTAPAFSSPNPIDAFASNKRRNFHHPGSSGRAGSGRKRKSYVNSLLVLQNFQNKLYNKQHLTPVTNLKLKRTSKPARYSSDYTMPSLILHNHPTTKVDLTKETGGVNFQDHSDVKLRKRARVNTGSGKERFLVQQFTNDLSQQNSLYVAQNIRLDTTQRPPHFRYGKELLRGFSMLALAATLPIVFCTALWAAAVTSFGSFVQANSGSYVWARVTAFAINVVGGVAPGTRALLSTALVLLLTIRIYFAIQQAIEKRQIWDKVLIQTRSLASLLQVHVVRPVVAAVPTKVHPVADLSSSNIIPMQQTTLVSSAGYTSMQMENVAQNQNHEEGFVGKNGRIGLVHAAIENAYQRQTNPDVAVALLAARYLACLGWMIHAQNEGLSNATRDARLRKLLPESERAWLLAQDDQIASMLTAIRHCTAVAVEHANPRDGRDLRLSWMESRLSQLEDSVGTLERSIGTPVVPVNLSQFTSRMVATWVLLLPFTMMARLPVVHPLVVTLTSMVSTAIVVGLEELGLTLEHQGSTLFPQGGDAEAATLQNHVRNEFLSLGQMRRSLLRP